MLVKLRLMLADLPEAPRGLLEVELEEGATVQQALEAMHRRHFPDGPARLMLDAMLIIDKKIVQLDTVLSDKDELMVIRPPEGG